MDGTPLPPLSPKKHTKEQLLKIVEHTLTDHPQLTKHPNLDKFKLGIVKELIHSYYDLKVIVDVAGELKEITKSRNRGISILNTPDDEWVMLQMYPDFENIWVCTLQSRLSKQEITQRINDWIESKQRALFFLA